MNKHIKGSIYIIISALGFGAMGIIAKAAYAEGVSIDTLLSLRFFAATLIFAIILSFRKISMKINRKQMMIVALLGMVCYASMSTLLYTAFLYISVPIAVLTFYCYPAIVTIISMIAGQEKITVMKAVSLVFSGIGLILVLQVNQGFNLKGFLLAIASALIYSIYIFISNKYTNEQNTLVKSMYISLFAAVALFLFGLQASKISLSISIVGWGSIIALALISTVLAFYFFFEGLEIVGPTKTSILSMLEPVFAVVLSAIFLHEQLSPVQWLGMMIVILSSLSISVNIEDFFGKKSLRIKKGT